MEQERTGRLALVGSALFYSSYGIFSKFSIGHFDPFYQAWTRSLLTLFCFLILGLLSKTAFQKIKKADIKYFAIVCVLGSCAVAPTYYSLAHLNLGTALFVQYGSTLVVGYVLGVVIMGEKLNFSKWLSLLLALAGLLLIFRGELRFTEPLPIIAAVLAGGFFTAALVITKKIESYSHIQINTIAYAVAVIVNLIAFLVLDEKANLEFSSVAWASNIGYGIAGFLGALLVVYGYKYVAASTASTILLLEILFGILFGFFIFGEQLNAQAFVGGLLILLAITLKSIIGLFKEKTSL